MKINRQELAAGCGTVEPFQQVPPGSEMQDLPALHGHSLASCGISAHTGIADPAGESAELAQLHPMAFRETISDLVQDRVESRFHHVPGQMWMRFSSSSERTMWPLPSSHRV